MGNFFNSRSYRAIGIAIPVLSVLFFWLMDAKMNIYQTSVTPGFLLGIANALLAWWIFKNKI